jgi:hypothetical protein
MSHPTADRKTLFVFGLLGVAGGLVAWALGEVLLALAASSIPTPEAHRSTSEPNTSPARPTVPAPTPDFATRLERVGAKSGDVQLSLIWDDANDLDLHCVGPDGHELYSATRDSPSPTGGRLDVDANTDCFGSDRGPMSRARPTTRWHSAEWRLPVPTASGRARRPTAGY